MHQTIHNILISEIAAIDGSEDQLAIQYVHTWVGDAPESRRTTLFLSLTLLFGISREIIYTMSVKSCMQLTSLSKSMHHTYLSSTIVFSGATINCCLDCGTAGGFL